MKNYKIYVSAILTLILIFGNITTCYCIESLEILEALGTVYSAVEASNSAESKRQAVSNWVHKNSEAAGFLFDATSSTLPSALWYLLPDSVQTELGENASDDDIIDACRTFILNNQTVSDNSVTDNSILKNGIQNYINNYISEYDSYCYTFGMQTNADMFSSVEQYNKAKEKINDANTLLGGLWFVVSNTIYSFDTTGVRDIYFKEVNSSSITSNGNVNVKVYNADTNEIIPASAQYDWNSTEHDYVVKATTGNINNYTKYVGLEPDPKRWSDGKYLIMTSKSKTYRFFKWNHSVTTNDILYSQYYINQPVYKDFSQSQGDYTLNSQNINTVSYGDVTSYIDSYNTENGNPPPVYDINNYITQQNEQNVSGGNGGSGDNGGDNGGGSGGSGDGSIFDWLKTLGAALGNLIKGVGEFLSEIVAGLVDAVTNLLQAISTLISGVLESLTNIFSGLIEFIYAGLPDDIRNILSLALVVAILITVLKLIRGN